MIVREKFIFIKSIVIARINIIELTNCSIKFTTPTVLSISDVEVVIMLEVFLYMCFI